MPGSLRLREPSTPSSSGGASPESRSRRELDFSGDLDFSSAGGFGRSAAEADSERRSRPSSWAGFSVELNTKAIFILWGIWAATELAAFLLGNSVGRQQGIRSALVEYRQEALRSSVPSSTQGAVLRGSEAEQLADGAATAAAISGTENLPGSPTERLFTPEVNESLMSKVPAVPPAVAAAAAGSRRAPSAEHAEIAPAAVKPRWIVKAATYRKRVEAEAGMKRAKKLNLPAVVETSERDGAIYYHLVFGPFASESKASQAKKQAVREKIVKGELSIRELPSQ